MEQPQPQQGQGPAPGSLQERPSATIKPAAAQAAPTQPAQDTAQVKAPAAAPAQPAAVSNAAPAQPVTVQPAAAPAPATGTVQQSSTVKQQPPAATPAAAQVTPAAAVPVKPAAQTTAQTSVIQDGRPSSQAPTLSTSAKAAPAPAKPAAPSQPNSTPSPAPQRTAAASSTTATAVSVSQDAKGNTALHTAVLSGGLADVQRLVKSGCPVDVSNEESETALVMAVNLAQPDKLDVVDALLELGANPFRRLHWAAHHGHHQVVSELLAAGASPDLQDDQGFTPMSKAAQFGHDTVINVLATAGANVHHTAADSPWTPILLAARAGHSAAIRMLVKHGARTEDNSSDQETPLILAAHGGHAKALQVLIESGAVLDAADSSLNTAVHRAAANGHTTCIELLMATSASRDIRNAKGATALVEAMNAKADGIVAMLKAAGANPNFQLHWAAQNGVTAVVRDLVMSHLVPINLQDTPGWTALNVAAHYGEVHVMNLLLEANASADLPTTSQQTPLMSAAARGHAEGVRLLLNSGANIKAISHNGQTALIQAAENGHLEAVRVLLEHCNKLPLDGPQPPVMPAALKAFAAAQQKAAGALAALSSSVLHDTLTKTMTDAYVDEVLNALKAGVLQECDDPTRLPNSAPGVINAQDFTGQTAVILASLHGYSDIVDALVASRADIHRTDMKGDSALHLASRLGYWEIVRILLAHGAALKLTNKQGHTPLHLAASGGHLQVVKYLITAQADINSQDEDGWAALHFAAFKGHVEVMEYLISKGADIHIQTVKGSTILYIATKGGSLAGVRCALKAGVSIKVIQVTGYNALHGATYYADTEVVKEVLAAGVPVNAKSRDQDAPLHYAADRGIGHMVEVLLDAGANIDEPDNQSATPLHYAIQSGHEQLIDMMLDRGARVESRDTADGDVPLTVAAKHGQVGILRKLLSRGADIDVRNNSGFTALHVAAQYGKLDIIKELLGKHGIDKFSVADTGRNLIHVASAFGQVEVVSYLIKEVGMEANQLCQPRPGRNADFAWARWAGAHLEVEGLSISSVGATLGTPTTALWWPITGNAMIPLPSNKGLVYVEFEVVAGDTPGEYCLGLAADNGRYDYPPGYFPGSIGYHAINGCRVAHARSNKEQYGAKWGKGDVVGLILNRSYRTLSFTRNGQHLGVAARNLDLSEDQFAMVAFSQAGATIIANNGSTGPFTFNMDDLLVEEENRHNLGAKEPWSFKEKLMPLHLAASSGSLGMLSLLLESGAVVDHTDADNWTALHFAALKGWDAGIQVLLDAGCNVNATTKHGTSPLILSVKHSHTQATRVLIDRGADYEVTDKDQRTLLMWAASTGNVEVIQMLIDKGVSIKAKDTMGRTAMQYASNETVVEYLEAALNRIMIYRDVFEINMQVEVRRGAIGTVIMAKHIPTSQAVAIKFHKHREPRDFSAQMVSQLSRKFIAGFPPGLRHEDAVFEDHKKYPDAPYALVLDGGDKDLDDILSEQGANPFPENQIRYIFECLATSVQHMHMLDLTHHDLKAKNFVRFFDGRYRLIDFDNTRQAGKQDMGLTTIEICPPEVAGALLRGDKLRSAASMDIWSLGCVMYQMTTQCQFLADLKPEWKGDITSHPRECLEMLAGLKQEQIDDMIDRVFSKKKGTRLVQHAASLIQHMLQVEPRSRFTISEVVNHAFLRGGNTATMDDDTLAGIRGQLVEINSKVDSVLAHVITIKERTLVLEDLPAQIQAGFADISQKISGIRSLVVDVHTKGESPGTFVIAPDLPLKDAYNPTSASSRQAVDSWIDDLGGIFTGKLSMSGIMTKLTKKRFRLKLVCEGCCKPVGDGYVVEQPVEWVAKMLPALQVTFQMARAYNIAASLGRLILPMLPVVPDDMMDNCRTLINGLKPKSTAEDFACIQTELDKMNSGGDPDLEPKEQVGAALRQLARFLEKNDPTRHWGGLALIQMEPQDETATAEGDTASKPPPKSSVLWVCPECISTGGCGTANKQQTGTRGKKQSARKQDTTSRAQPLVQGAQQLASGMQVAVVEESGCFGSRRGRSNAVHPVLE